MLAAILVLVGMTHAQQAGIPQPRHERIRVSAEVAESFLKHKVDLVYPAEARAHRIQGDVVLEVLISESGDVVRLKTISGHPLLTDAATDAVRQWKYRPFRADGKPIEMETKILVKFRLG